MSAACENYKADNGIYPRNPDTDGLNAQIRWQIQTLRSIRGPAFISITRCLGQRMEIAHLTPERRSYFVFKPNMLSPADQTQNVQFIRDPFGNSYGYSTIQAATGNTRPWIQPDLRSLEHSNGLTSTSAQRWQTTTISGSKTGRARPPGAPLTLRSCAPQPLPAGWDSALQLIRSATLGISPNRNHAFRFAPD